jgi:hypothetical protein
MPEKLYSMVVGLLDRYALVGERQKVAGMMLCTVHRSPARRDQMEWNWTPPEID